LRPAPDQAEVRLRRQVVASDPGGVVYVSQVRIERGRGRERLAYLPAESEPVVFGIHSQVAERLGAVPNASEEHATTLDYVVAAVGG
jgi:hypothetical protein